jgi:hypothetical protein
MTKKLEVHLWRDRNLIGIKVARQPSWFGGVKFTGNTGELGRPYLIDIQMHPEVGGRAVYLQGSADQTDAYLKTLDTRRGAVSRINAAFSILYAYGADVQWKDKLE